jgi:hypothetical protein
VENEPVKNGRCLKVEGDFSEKTQPSISTCLETQSLDKVGYSLHLGSGSISYLCLAPDVKAGRGSRGSRARKELDFLSINPAKF